jgi:hypothetical protein
MPLSSTNMSGITVKGRFPVGAGAVDDAGALALTATLLLAGVSFLESQARSRGTRADSA